MFLSVPRLRIRRKQAVLPGVPGGGRIRDLNSVQCNLNKFTRPLCRNADRIPCRIFSLRGNLQIGYDFVGNFILILEVQKDFYAVRSLMLVGNIDFEGILISRVVLCFDRKIVLSGFSFIQEKLNRVRCFQGPGSVAIAGSCTLDGGDLSAVGIGADNGHFIFQKSIGQFVIIHGIRRFGLLILAENLSPTAIIERITHLQCDIISDVQNDFKVSRMAVCKSGNRNPICIGGFTRRHSYSKGTLSFFVIQFIALACSNGDIAGIQNFCARAFGISADQFHLVANPTGQLVVLDFIRNTAIGQAKQRAFVIAGSPPCKGKLHIRELLICDLIPEKHIPFHSPDRK